MLQTASHATSGADKVSTALVAQRDLTVFTVLAAVPMLLLCGLLLFGGGSSSRMTGALTAIAGLGALVSLYAMGRLLWELTMDIAGVPDYVLPVWAVLYLITYVVLGFAYVYFGLYVSSPGSFIRFGDSTGGAGAVFIDSLYLSLCGFLTKPPDVAISVPSQGARFLMVGQGLLSMFINAVIITKFVSAF